MSFFKKTSHVSTDAVQIQELITRGVERVFPSGEFLEKKLKSGERLTIYHGIDPTGKTLHIGHAVPLLKLAQFQKLGHRIILLVGDFTARIGDPTDKMAARVPLTEEQVRENAKEYKKQAGSIIAFGGANPAVLRYNSEWLKKLSAADTYKLLSEVTYAQTIKRDMFQKRLAEGRDLFLHEFLYPILQGYDSVALDVDGEVGGNDQTFNMLMGRDLMKRMRQKEKFVIAVKLLVDAEGKKMGKTEGNMVSFLDSPADCFGKIMSWPDGMILTGLELCTLIPTSDIETMKRQLEEGTNPKEVKMKLAEAVVSLLHGEAEAKKARTGFNAAFTEGKPEEFLEISVSETITVGEALVVQKVVESKSDLRRLIGEKAVTNLGTGEKMGEDFLKTAPAGKYRIGKHRFIEIK
ncbi:MAG: tyrosine--tRNA ligase [bacterium]|nr:tyrosine--tRNA ligase [bacterium]